MGYVYEPAKPEVLFMELAGNTVLRGYYRDFARSLGLVKGQRVLDWCAGSGIIAGWMAKRGGRALVFADVSKTWLAHAGKKLKACANAEGVLLDGFCGVIGGGGYDRIAVHYALHDFPAGLRLMILRQLAANLAPGGILALREPISRRGSHGIRLCDLINLLEAEKALVYEYSIEKHWLVGEYIDARCRLSSIDAIIEPSN